MADPAPDTVGAADAPVAPETKVAPAAEEGAKDAEGKITTPSDGAVTPTASSKAKKKALSGPGLTGGALL